MRLWERYAARLPREFSDRQHGGQELPLHEGNLNYLDGCGRVLDIGCGVGRAVELLRSRGLDAVGVTVNRREQEEAAARSLSLDLGDMHDLPYPDGSFGGALMWDVLEHALAPLVALWEAHRVLRQDGKLLVYLPPQLWIEHDVHTWVPTQRQARQMFKLGGFAVEGMEDRQDESAVWRLCRVDGAWPEGR